jgi:drug/metabolite transporter (DMT)-like permease
VGYLYAFTAAFLFGANGTVTKVMIEAGISALQITQMRVLGSAIVAGAVLFVLDRHSFRVPRGQRLALVVMGVVGVGVLQASYALAVELLPVGIALLLEYLAVPMVAVFAFVVFKERVRTRIWVSIGLIMAGLAVVAQIWDSSLNAMGTLWALIAALSLATYFLVGEKQMETISPLALMFWSMTIAATFWAFISGWWRIDPSTFAQSVPLTGVLEGVPAPMWFLLLWNVVMGSFAPFLLSLAAIKKLSATAAGIAATSEIVFAFIVAWLWLGENLSGSQIIGASVVLAGIILAQTARRSPVPITADLAMETGPIVLPAHDEESNA